MYIILAFILLWNFPESYVYTQSTLRINKTRKETRTKEFINVRVVSGVHYWLQTKLTLTKFIAIDMMALLSNQQLLPLKLKTMDRLDWWALGCKACALKSCKKRLSFHHKNVCCSKRSDRKFLPRKKQSPAIWTM